MKEAGSRLTVSTDTLVRRVLFNGKRAVGVEFQTGGKGTPVKRAYASKEVDLS
jgi:choline dehydrogenase-like flavoprotein